MDGKINKYPEDRVALASVISATEISFLRVGHTIQQHEENRVAAKKILLDMQCSRHGQEQKIRMQLFPSLLHHQNCSN